ncbi:MAG: hypothetical protein FJ088_08015, partial [Deltaproteobacteria bacterium]|nr:hypothetical protein [Deltaproteobacteria bacterium]
MKKRFFTVFILSAAVFLSPFCKKKQAESVISEAPGEKSEKPDEPVKHAPEGREPLIKGEFKFSKWDKLAPEVKDILSGAFSSAGGEDALKKMQSYYYESSGEIYGFPFDAKCFWRSPGDFRMEIKDGAVFIKKGDSAAMEYNGVVFDVIKEDRELAGMSLFARYLATLAPFREGGMHIEYWGEGELFKKKALKFKLRADFAENPLFAYFDAKTYLLYAVEYSVWNRYKTRTFIEVFDDYRDVGGVQVPYGRTVRSDGAVILSETLASFEFRGIGDDAFRTAASGGIKTGKDFYLRETPEKAVAFASVKGHYGKVVDEANALVKKVAAAGEGMDSVPFATHLFSDQF